jgi:hypothetical protein
MERNKVLKIKYFHVLIHRAITNDLGEKKFMYFQNTYGYKHETT